MGRYRGARSALELAAKLSESQKSANAIARKGQNIKTAKRLAAEADQKAADAESKAESVRQQVEDDGLPPEAPMGVVALPFTNSLDVTWADPDPQDHVRRSIVEITPQGASVLTYRGAPESIFIKNLSSKPHTLKVRFEDRWARIGPWSGSVTATPQMNVTESINLTTAQIAGSLGWANLDSLNDPNKLGNAVITARAMATQNLAATRLWAQTGAFESAMIVNLAVDKLTAGTFTAGDITLAGAGRLRAGSNVTLDSAGIMAGLVTLDAQGMTLPRWTGNVNAPAANRDMKISTGDELSAISFFLDTTYERRGINLRADGASLLSAGVIALEATPMGGFGERETDDGWVYIRARKSGQPDGHVYLGPRLVVTGRIKAEGLEPNYYCFPKSVNSGAEVAWTHNLGNDQYLAHMQYRRTSEASWTGLHNDVTGIYIKGLHPNEIRLQNNTNVTLVVRGFLINMRGLS